MESIHKLGKLFEEMSSLFNSIDISNQLNSLINENSKLKEEMKELIETHQNKCDELNQTKNKYDKEIKDQKEELVRLTKISLIQQYDKQLKEQNEYIKIIETQLEKYKNSSKSQLLKIVPTVQVDSQVYKDALNNNLESKVANNLYTEKSDLPINNNDVNNHKQKKGKKTKSEIVENNEQTQELFEPVLEQELTNNDCISKKKKKQKYVEDNVNEVQYNLHSNLEDNNELDNLEDINGYELTLYKKSYYLRDLETNELYDIENNKPNHVVGLINSKGRVKFN